MKVHHVMNNQIRQISHNASLREAARKMQMFKIGSLPVIKDRHLIGIITDRDIVVRALATGLDTKQVQVTTIMSHPPITCHPKDDIEVALSLMQRHRVRRLMVMDDQDILVGILSVGDLCLKTKSEPFAHEALESICEPAVMVV